MDIQLRKLRAGEFSGIACALAGWRISVLRLSKFNGNFRKSGKSSDASATITHNPRILFWQQ
jgi:hypothetical protein